MGGLRFEVIRQLTARRAQKVASVALLCVALSGCALLGAGKKAANTYDLLAPAQISAGQRTGLQIIVNTPSAVRSLESDRILVKPAASQLAYFPAAVWSDRLPRLVQARLVEAMQNSGRFRAVGDGRDKIDGDIQVLGNIRAFQIDVVEKFATAHIEIFIKLVDDKSQRTVSSKKFSAFSDASDNNTEAGIAALNKAFQKLVPQIVKWVGQVRVTAKVESSEDG